MHSQIIEGSHVTKMDNASDCEYLYQYLYKARVGRRNLGTMPRHGLAWHGVEASCLGMALHFIKASCLGKAWHGMGGQGTVSKHGLAPC